MHVLWIMTIVYMHVLWTIIIVCMHVLWIMTIGYMHVLSTMTIVYMHVLGMMTMVHACTSKKNMAHGFGFRASVIRLRSSRHSSDAIVGMSTVVYRHERRDR